MKRSQMLIRLMETLVEAPSDLELAANYILTQVEQAGMKPPYSNDAFQKQAKVFIQPEGYDWDPED